MRGGFAQPRRRVDINHLPGLDAIEQLADGGPRIGSACALPPTRRMTQRLPDAFPRARKPNVL
jgi:CO/xanthine dehydrogenase FAD-binding subunit